MAMHLRPFEEIAGGTAVFEFCQTNEMIMDAVNLGRPARARRNRYGKRQIDCRILEQHPRQSGFAGARWRGQDEHQTAAFDGQALSNHGPHSIFWICSRSCSISALRSSPIAVNATLLDFAHKVLASRPNS